MSVVVGSATTCCCDVMIDSIQCAQGHTRFKKSKSDSLKLGKLSFGSHDTGGIPPFLYFYVESTIDLKSYP